METDEALLARIAGGEEDAFVTFVERHHARLERFVACQTRPGDSWREDAVQDTLVTVLERAHTFEGRSSAVTWLLGIARFKVLHHRQRRARSREVPEDLAALGARAGWGAGHIEAAYELGRVLETISTLPPIHSEVLVLRDLEGLSTREAAEVLGVQEAAVKSRLHRARLHLMAALREEVEP
jgi:RNA polymerase sigma-70 factor (ECF subfamily)